MGEQWGGEGRDGGMADRLRLRAAEMGTIGVDRVLPGNAVLMVKAAGLIDEMAAALEEMAGACVSCGGSGVVTQYGDVPTEASCPDCRKARDLIARAKGGA